MCNFNIAALWKPYSLRAKKQTRLTTDGHTVRGVVQLGDKIYIACISKPAIIVYKAEASFQRLDDIAVEELSYPRDIAASSSNMLLYVSDKNTLCIWTVCVRDLKVTKWIENLKCGATLSVTADERVLVMDGRDVHMHTSDGTQVLKFRLPDDLKEPQRIIATDRQTFFVSHGETCGIHRICEVSTCGKVLRFYGGQNGRERDQIDWPVYTASDKDGGLIVLDAQNTRLLHFDSKLKLRRVLLTRQDGLDAAIRISYHKESGNLLIGIMSAEKGGVDVLKI